MASNIAKTAIVVLKCWVVKMYNKPSY